jgi:CRP-like cAMP-binding protein
MMLSNGSRFGIDPLFHGVDAQHLALLRPLFERVSYRAGTTVIEQGAAADFLYLIEHGRLAISYKPYDGEPITITHVEDGGLFGWSAVVGSDHYTSSGLLPKISMPYASVAATCANCVRNIRRRAG